MLLDITAMSSFFHQAAPVPQPVLAAIYLACTIGISKLYVVQAYKFLRGENGAGDYCFISKIVQAMLRVAGLAYAAYINDGTIFLVIALDFLGRWVEIASAMIARRRLGITNSSGLMSEQASAA